MLRLLILKHPPHVPRRFLPDAGDSRAAFNTLVAVEAVGQNLEAVPFNVSSEAFPEVGNRFHLASEMNKQPAINAAADVKTATIKNTTAPVSAHFKLFSLKT